MRNTSIYQMSENVQGIFVAIIDLSAPLNMLPYKSLVETQNRYVSQH